MTKDLYQYSLGDYVMVSVNEFNDEKKIHIRKFVVSNNGTKSPTKCGVTLCLRRYLQLINVSEEVDDAVTKMTNETQVNMSSHLVGNWYVSVNSKFPGISVRRFWFHEGELKPTRRGIHLSVNQWRKMSKHMPYINGYIPELNSTVPCYLGLDHQSGFLDCKECYPNHTVY